MRSEKLNAWKRIVVLSVSVIISSTLCAKMSGQHEIPNVSVGSNCHGYLEYLPNGYVPSGSTRYPLLINILGLGTTGDGSQASLDLLYNIHGGNPHDQAFDNVWPDAFTVNSQTFQFIVITPQFIQNMLSHIPTPSEVDEVITYMIQHYKVDTSRVYLIGSSQGAGAVWDYAGGGSQYAKRLAAIIPFAGVSFPFQEKANIMKFAKVAVWGFHNDLDNSVPSSFTKDYVNFYNNTPTPFGITAKKTIFPSTTAHECWFNPLTRAYTENGLNVYQWMLQYHTDPTTANSGDDQEIVLPSNQVQLTASGTAPDGTAASYHWEEYFGPTTGGTIASPNSLTTNVTNLSQGSYIFKLTITGNNASTAIDYVAITVNPIQQRIEDNAFIVPNGSSGVSLNNPTVESSNGNATRVNDISNNDWVKYDVTVSSAGTYRFRFRVGTFYPNTRFKVQNAAGTQDLSAPVALFTTNWDVYMDLYTDVNLQEGTQTIRIQNYPVTGSENNTWYLNWFEVINNTQAIYSADGPLPVTFSMFNVNCSGNSVNLSWKTANESNSSEFSIEKSSDGRNWKSIGTVAAAGQSSTEKTYTYADHSAGGNDFYRIIQEDQNGKRTYTAILKSNCSGGQTFSVFPNPVNDRATLTIGSNQNAKLNVSIVDSKGSVVRKQQALLSEGNSQVDINLSGLAKGIYTLQAKWNNQTKTTKLIKN